MHCLICGSSDLGQRRIGKIGRQAYRCRACAFEFLWPQQSPQEIADIYKESYYECWDVTSGRENELTANLKRSTSDRSLRALAPYRTAAVRLELLDIGCAFGYLLDAAAKRGYDVRGVELSDFSSGIARQKYGDRVVHGRLEDAAFRTAQFDAVSMLDLIEHIPDPMSFMKEVRRIVKPGGYIVLTTPDTGSLTYKLFGPNGWFHWKHEHLVYFNRRSLAELACRTGFELIEKRVSYKTLNFEYLYAQFHVFRHWLFTPIAAVLNAFLPAGLKRKSFPIAGGEMLAVLRAI